MITNPSSLHALLVGINEYAVNPEIKNLSGCVNDVTAVKQLLRKFSVPSENIHILINKQAKYQAIKSAFQEHLIDKARAWNEAGKVDTTPAFLFYFSGHGSQAKDETKTKPSYKDETIVPHDSRTEGVFDIKDWELGQLLNDLAEYAGDNITVILDCCHSGSGTRGDDNDSVTNIRRCLPDKRPQPSKNPNPKKRSRSATKTNDWMQNENHVLLAACRNTEKAKEVFMSDSKSDCKYGVMTYFLVNELAKMNSEHILTYRELNERVCYQVKKLYKEQMPQCEGDRDRLVLSGLRPKRDVLLTVFEKNDGYSWVNGGIAHLLTEGSLLKVYPPETRTLAEAGEPIALLSVDEVEATRSGCVVEEGQRDIPINARVAIHRLNNMQSYVLLDISDKLLHKKLKKELCQPEIEQYVRLAEKKKEADFCILLATNQLKIQDNKGNFLTEPFEINNLYKLSQNLIHLARYRNTLNFNNTSKCSKLAGAVSIAVKLLDFKKDTQDPFPEDIIPNKLGNLEIETGKNIVIEVTNHHDALIYFSILRFNNCDWSIKKIYPNQGKHEQLASGQTFFIGLNRKRSERITIENLPDNISEALNVIKVIVSLEETEFEVLELPALGKNISRRGSSANDKWTSYQCEFYSIQPLINEPIAIGGKITPLGLGVALKGHPSLKAKAFLNSISQGSRDVDTPIPPLLQNNDSIQTYDFAEEYVNQPEVNVLELTDIEDHKVVTPEQPLIFNLKKHLATNEHLLPIAYDGEFFLPLGKAIRSNSSTEIQLERLPEPTSSGERDLTGSIKIYLYKVANQIFDTDYSYPQLAIALVDKQSQVKYSTDNIQNKIKNAKRILLYIHGIIGDTRIMAGSANPSGLKLETPPPALVEHYDLILSFDYENLDTSIKQTARDLKQRLEAVGLGANHDKTLHIIAHSMGGLVSRWFIEQEGGKQVVQHLVMLGTPNGGAPFATFKDWGTTALSLYLNGLSGGMWSTYTLGGLLKIIESLDFTLDEMNPNSKFLQELANSPDPKIPYTIIAGNTSLIPTLKDKNTVLARLWSKIIASGYFATDLAFFGSKANDIAASVESIKNVPDNRSPKPVKLDDIPCNHLSYFNTEVGLISLANSLFSEK